MRRLCTHLLSMFCTGVCACVCMHVLFIFMCILMHINIHIQNVYTNTRMCINVKSIYINLHTHACVLTRGRAHGAQLVGDTASQSLYLDLIKDVLPVHTKCDTQRVYESQRACAFCVWNAFMFQPETWRRSFTCRCLEYINVHTYIHTYIHACIHIHNTRHSFVYVFTRILPMLLNE